MQLVAFYNDTHIVANLVRPPHIHRLEYGIPSPPIPIPDRGLNMSLVLSAAGATKTFKIVVTHLRMAPSRHEEASAERTVPQTWEGGRREKEREPLRRVSFVKVEFLMKRLPSLKE